jgi:hypothetical protein
MTRWLFVLFVLVIACLPATARAGEPSIAAPRSSKVEWHEEWPRFSAWEGALTFAATVGVYVAERRLPDPDYSRLTFEVPILDPGARYLLRGRTKNVRDAFQEYSDVGFRMMAFLPYVVDVGASALVAHRNPDVAAQLMLIDIQALTLSGATQLLLSRAAGRERPYVQDCPPGRVGEAIDGASSSSSTTAVAVRCGTNTDFKSFYSGHAAGAFTSAGLVCLHHQNLPLFGGGPIETWACTWALGVATLTGVARIVYDAHYASDVIVGAGVGWFYGYVMPKLMHFRGGSLVTGPPTKLKSMLQTFSPSLLPTADGAVVSASGIF